MGKRILITGSTGFFGRALLRHFLSTDHGEETTIFALSRNPERFQVMHPALADSKNISFICGDIESRETLPWEQKFTHVLHAATDSTVGPSLSPIRRYQQIVSGTTNILDLAVATGATRFLLTSSGGIYGHQTPSLSAIPEDWSGAPSLDLANNAYSHGKRAAEYLCTLYNNEFGLETVIARCFAFVGPDLPLDVHFAIGNFIRDALSSTSITVSGDGTPLRTYLHQDDLAHWLLTLLEHAEPGSTYNVGSDEVISIGDLACLVRNIISPEKTVEILGKSIFGAARNQYIPDITKARRQLDLDVTISLSDAIHQFCYR